MQGSLRHIIRSNFVDRDYGEFWSDEMDTEASPPILCTWANGGLPVETKIVFHVAEEESSIGSPKKIATRSVTSYLRRKQKSVVSKKIFKEFKPRAKGLNESENSHPRLKKAREKEKEIEVVNPAFPHLDLEGQIEKMRVKVEKEAKRRKIELDVRK